ncbi:MAG: glycosyltransferase family 39 protein [Patescibacteria group bacterium]
MPDSLITKHRSALLLILYLVVLFNIFWSPTGSFVGTPKYWWDESFAIETARTILEIGRIDVTVAPNTPSNIAVALNANGFPLTLPLAGIFSIFGISLLVARVYMIFWIIGVLVMLFYTIKNFFDWESAWWGTLLVATFAPFYANGKTVTGDMPGIFFFLLGILLVGIQKKYTLGGVAFGLAFAAKTSLFHMVFPAIAIALVITERYGAWKPLIRVTLGSSVVVAAWLLLLLPHPYSLANLSPAIEFYKHPISKASVLQALPESLSIFFSTTILYVILLTVITIAAFLRKPALSKETRIFLAFIASYILLQSIVFVRSPGWYRYLLGVEMVLLTLLFPALMRLRSRTEVSKKTIALGLTVLVAFQSGHYLFFSNIFSRQNPTQVSNILNELLVKEPGSTIGFIDAPTEAALIPGNRKYHYLRVGGGTYAGVHPLTLPPALQPTYIYTTNAKAAASLTESYERITATDGVTLYRKKQ